MKKLWGWAPITLWLSFVFIILILIVALAAPWIAPFSIDDQNLLSSYATPSLKHFFGADALGRDLLSRLIFGCRVSMSIALVTAVSSLVIGTLYGSFSAFMGGWVDTILMRLVDIFYTLPSLIVMILVMLLVGRDFFGIFIALTLTGWLGTARLMRAQVLSWKNRPFVEAARALGVTGVRLFLKHILPNTLGPLMVELSYQIPSNILAEAFLSFLGIGIRPPTPSWGILAEEGWRALQSYPHLSLFPGLFIFLTMLSFNRLGDFYQNRLDPYLKDRAL